MSSSKNKSIVSPLALIVCYARHRVIGHEGRLPWKCPEDLRRFRALTMGHTLIMGRRTFESLPHTLDGRTSVVLSRDPRYHASDALTTHSITEAVQRAYEIDPEPIVCGGGEVYAEVMPLITRMYLTEINREVKGDTWFPVFDEKEWRTVEQSGEGDVRFRTIERVKKKR